MTMNEAPAQKRILIIKLGALGDFIQALGPMRAIRQHYADDHITLLTTVPFVDLAYQSRYCNEVWVDKKPRWVDIAGWLELRRHFIAGAFDRVYDLQNNDRTALYLRLFTPRPEWVGAARGASIRNASFERTAGKAFDGHVQTLALAGIHGIKPDTMTWVAPSHDFSGLPAPYTLIVPGASARHPHKRWPEARYGDFCQLILNHGYQPVLIGSAEDGPACDTIARSDSRIINLCGQTTIYDLPSLARGATGAAGNDTGPMHIIAQAGCPSIVLFSGRTNPRKHGPVGHDVITIQKERLEDLQAAEVFAAFARQHKKD
jgi:ADP-heptose:LPS heptosyltransferase